MRALVVVASKHQATREIAEAIAAGLAARGVNAEARPVEEVRGVDGYDAVVVGSAIYMGRWLKPARRFVETNARQLASIPVWLFSSGPLGPADHLLPEGEPADAPEMTSLAHARDHRVFAGRLEKKRLGLTERAAVAAVRAPEGDSRDWGEIDAFAGEIASALQMSAPNERGTSTQQ
jgi:menaquinone-dependent protoporphyrinogen oxidase